MEEVQLPSLEERQAIRLGRYSLAAFAYLLLLPPLFLAHWLGFIPLGPSLVIAGLIVAINAGLFLAFWTGLNLRFPDPSLTKLQVYIGVSLLMITLYFTTVD